MYIIPSLFTVSNIFCGFYSVTCSIRGIYETAGALIGLAMILDTLDGRIARMTHTTSAFGVQLDSLADVITFGVAPGVLCYQWAFSDFSENYIHRAGWLVSFLFLICAAARLARFNVQTTGNPDKRYFIGMPTPAAAGVVASTVFAFPTRLDGHLVTAIGAIGVMLLLGFLMVSQVKYRTFKDINLKEPHSWRVVVLIALIITGIAFVPQITLITMATLYAISGIVGYLFGKKKVRPEASLDSSMEEPKPANLGL